ncbi:hypothetical protein ACHAW6_000345 [Cyclotella cf. meneghiniana]
MSISNFAHDEIEFLDCILIREGIKPQSEQVSVVLALKPFWSIKDLHIFLGLVQYYWDLWGKHSHLLAQLTGLIVMFLKYIDCQMGAVITQRGPPLAFFSHKLNAPPTKHTVTELELLFIVECLKELMACFGVDY